MNIIKQAVSLFIFLFTISCDLNQDYFSNSVDDDLEKALINEIVDSWHLAASKADSATYFSIIANDNSIFQGTDDSERWTKTEFKNWSREYFKRKSAWTFVPQKGRNINIKNNVAWFDEKLDSKHMGRTRGNGVMVKDQETWKIEHYTLSLPIPNELINGVIDTIKNSDY
jgi:hypothetical protein